MHLLDLFAPFMLISITDIPEWMISSAMSVRRMKILNKLTLHFVIPLANELRWQWAGEGLLACIEADAVRKYIEELSELSNASRK